MLEGLHPVFLTLCSLRRPRSDDNLARQVFWFSDPSTTCAFPPGFSRQWQYAGFVPDYSGGTTPDFNGIPF